MFTIHYVEKFSLVLLKQNMSYSVREGDTICSICFVTWIGQSPRCLPCKESIHIFCSDCLENFAIHNRLKSNDKFFCPVCNFGHTWKNDGILSFPRLTLFDRSPIKDKYNKTERFYMEKISLNRKKSEIENAVTSAIKNINEEENEIFAKIFETARQKMLDIKEVRDKLIQEIIYYFDDKETNLKEIIKEFEAFELFSNKIGKDEFKDNLTEMRIKLTNKAMKILNKTIEFKVTNNNFNEKINIGENIINENLIITNELINIPSFKNPVTLACYKNNLYLILEKYLNNSFIYRLVLYDTTSDRFDFLHEWKSSREREYKLAINNELYLLLIGDREIKYLKEILRKDNRNICKFDTFCSTDKNTEYYNSIIDFKYGIIASSTILDQKCQIFKIRNPFKIEWNIFFHKRGEWYINMQIIIQTNIK